MRDSGGFWRILVTRRAICGAVVILTVALLAQTPAFAWQDGADAAVTTQPAAVAAPPATATTQPAAMSIGEYYGLHVLWPPAVAIVLAIAFRQVLPALLVGVLVGAGMIGYYHAAVVESVAAGSLANEVSMRTITLGIETYILGALTDTDHAKILLFTSLIGAMVGILSANGGTQAMVDRVSRYASTRQRGQGTTWFAGLILFFDDYANAMLIGPAMRPVTDRLKISREKLAYIVDSTAAPVASIALIGTWVGVEISYIANGLDSLGERPAFLADVSGYGAFLQSLLYRFYPILALVMVFLVAVMNRDFGPMLKAERRVQTEPEEPVVESVGARNRPAGKMWYAVAPGVVLIALTVGLLVWSGYEAIDSDKLPSLSGFDLIKEMIANADPYNSILYGAFAGAVLAFLISIFTGALRVGQATDAATGCMAKMFPTFLVLILAWALSTTMTDLQFADVAVATLKSEEVGLNPMFLPLAVFLTSCVVSFATGSSWGTMGILCPATVTIAAGMLADMPSESALPTFYASVGAVLAGAVFGDHCSPISDTTVLSSLACNCRHERHVWTQIPYAITTAIVAIVAGNVLVAYSDDVFAWAGVTEPNDLFRTMLPIVGMLAGAVVLMLILLIIGRRPDRGIAAATPMESAPPPGASDGQRPA